MLRSVYNQQGLREAGCDEAGRGCLAGAVFAAAVILPEDYTNSSLNDSKQLTARRREILRREIERDALAWAVAMVSPEEIDRINILNASILAMHRALDALSLRPEMVIIDGNRFRPYVPGYAQEHAPLPPITAQQPHISYKLITPSSVAPFSTTDAALPHATIVKGDAKFLSIAAASILAKTYRDDYMSALHLRFPHYAWDKNAGYPTRAHRAGILEHGITPYHRRSYRLLEDEAQLKMAF